MILFTLFSFTLFLFPFHLYFNNYSDYYCLLQLNAFTTYFNSPILLIYFMLHFIYLLYLWQGLEGWEGGGYRLFCPAIAVLTLSCLHKINKKMGKKHNHGLQSKCFVYFLFFEEPW